MTPAVVNKQSLTSFIVVYGDTARHPHAGTVMAMCPAPQG